jgi:hypothetical protein
MAFVNENPISEADIEKYGLRALIPQHSQHGYELEWTIDRERDIYLRLFWYGDGGRDPEFQKAEFSFYWKGRVIPVFLWLDKYEKNRGTESATVVWKMHGVGSDKTKQWLPETHEPFRQEILADLKEALTIRKGVRGVNDYRAVDISFDF